MLNRKNSYFIFFILFAAAVTVFGVFGDCDEAERCRAFLTAYGWEVENAVKERETVEIPAEFDEVYTAYNKLQKAADLDLERYRGKSGVRYSFVVSNYPMNVGATVYANVLCVNGKPIGGDIMTVGINGFMHALSENTP